MKPKAIVKLTLDAAMTVLFLFLMGYHFWGHTAHEWIGTGMLVLFITHNILNIHWYRSLCKGKYTPVRVLGIVINILMLMAMLAQMYSGISMSRQVFIILPAMGGMALARRLHILGAYWGFVLMSLHLGMHWNMIISMFRKARKKKNNANTFAAIPFVLGLFIAGYGLFAFVKRNFTTYMLLRSEFVFLDYSESKILFYVDYLALMGLCVFLPHYCVQLLHKLNGSKNKRN